MDDKMIKEVAYLMQQAYTDTHTYNEAYKQVNNQIANDENKTEILFAMWTAIDAYIDVNE